MMKDKKIAVIGSGISGLAVSVMLRNQGFTVDVYEKNTYAGGKVSEIKMQGFRFDTGPSLFTLPDIFLKLFEDSGEKFTDYFDYHGLDIVCRYFYGDGKVIDSYSDANKFANEALNIVSEPVRNVKRYLRTAASLYNLTSDIFIFNSMHDFETYKKAGLRGLKSLFKLDALRSYHRLNEKSFKSKHLVQLFDRYATYNGSNPYKAPATLKVISHLEHNIGAYFPVNGMRSIPNALVKLGEDMGVNYFLNNGVDRVVPKDTEDIHIMSKMVHDSYNAVVSTVDVTYFYNKILEGGTLPQRIKNAEPSSSAIIFYWGIKKEFSQLKLHNILFSGDYKKEFEHIFDRKSVYDDPTIYIFISSKHLKTDAPAGCENWFVMINTPSNTGQWWDEVTFRVRKVVIEKINRLLGEDIEQYIECEEISNPVSIENQTSSFRGSIYGNSSNSIFSAFNRHPNFSKKFKNLYFAGGSVHPGGGIPLCIASARIVANQIKKSMK